jgi:hypothetical protein
LATAKSLEITAFSVLPALGFCQRADYSQ